MEETDVQGYGNSEAWQGVVDGTSAPERRVQLPADSWKQMVADEVLVASCLCWMMALMTGENVMWEHICSAAQRPLMVGK